MKRHQYFNRLFPLFMVTLALLIGLESSSQVKQEWVRKFNGPVNGNDGGGDIAVGSDGNVYATGRVQDSRFANIATIKYDAAGNQKWIKYYRYTDDGYFQLSGSYGHKISCDKNYNIYVLGSSGPNLIDDDFYSKCTVIKYDSSGNEEWLSSTEGEAIDMSVGDVGNVYTASEMIGHVAKTFITTAFNTNGKVQWSRGYVGYFSGYSNFSDRLKSLETDNEGNVYTGALVYLDPTLFDPSHGFSIIRYDAEGTLQSDHWYQGDSVNLFAKDAADKFYTAGNLSASELLFMKLTKDGDIIWNTKVTTEARVEKLIIDQSGNVYTTGRSAMGLSTVKIGSDGVMKWEKFHEDSKNFEQLPRDLVTDSVGNIYLLIQSINSSNLSDFVIIKYDANGNQQWEQRYDGPAKDDDVPAAIALDQFANIYVTGTSKGIETDYDFVTIKYSQTPPEFGVCCFDNGFGPRAKCGSNVTPLNCSKSGKDAFFAGSVSDCSLIDTATLCGKTPSIVHIDATYFENERSVQVSWQRKESSSITGYYIQRSSDGFSFKSIGFMPVNTSGNYVFTDPYPEIENYYKLVWFERKGFESNKVMAMAIDEGKVRLMPNPAADKVKILIKDLQLHNSRITVIDNAGRIVLRSIISINTSPEIDISHLHPGIYLLTIEQNGKTFKEKFVKK